MIKYRLVKYYTKKDGNLFTSLSDEGMKYILEFDRYIFGIRIGKKKVEVQLPSYVNWRKHRNHWDDLIKSKAFLNKIR